MRTSAARPSKPAAAGFTLIEILVTLMIMAMLAGMASLSIGGGAHRQARDESVRLFQVLDFASDEATLQGEELGLQFEEDGYAVLRFDAESETWSEATERQLAAYTLPSTVRMEVTLGEVPELARRNASRGAEERRPEVLVLSSGEITPFEVEFRAGEERDAAGSIRSDGSGNLRRD